MKAVSVQIGDTIENESGEIGRVVRIAETDRGGGYVVVKKDRFSGGEIEAWWRPRELKKRTKQPKSSRAATYSAS